MTGYRIIEHVKSPFCVKRALLWYLFWLAVILCLYWPGILEFPKKDHPVFMLGRHLAANDFDWFLGVLSYTRTRILLPGDYFGFRPLHMAVIALEDLFFRHQFAVQGIICCSIQAFAATAFFQLLRRIVPAVLAFSLVIFWLPQLAGSEIVLWQHINPYLLSPAFLCLAVYLVTDENWSPAKGVTAASAVLLACLTHEISVIIACAISSIALAAVRSEPVFRKRCAVVFLVPAVMALALNGIDYMYIHPPPSLLAPADSLARVPLQTMLLQVSQFVGAIGIAFIVPGKVVIDFTNGWLHSWSFWNLPESLLLTSTLLVTVFIVAASGLACLRLLRSGMNTPNLMLTLLLLLFFSSAGVSIFRILSRGLVYMATATYYFSLISFALCGIVAVITAGLNKRNIYAVSTFLLMLAGWHAFELHRQLRTVEPAKQHAAQGIENARDLLSRNPALCFNGMDLSSTPADWHLWGPLFQDLSCTVRPGSVPVYVSATDSSAALVGLNFIAPPAKYSDILSEITASAAKSGRDGRPMTDIELSVKAGVPVEFTLRDTPLFGLSIIDPRGKRRGVKIYHNLVWEVSGDTTLQRNSTTWNPAKHDIAYRIVYTDNEMLLFGNGQLLTFWPSAVGREGPLSIGIGVPPAAPAPLFTRFMVGDAPSQGQIAVEPVYY